MIAPSVSPEGGLWAELKLNPRRRRAVLALLLAIALARSASLPQTGLFDVITLRKLRDERRASREERRRREAETPL